MATNKTPYTLEVDMRDELIELFTGGEFVPKWQPYVIRQSVIDENKRKIKCSCYDHIANEGKSDCPLCFGAGYIWKEIIVPGYKWSPRNILMAAQNSYKSYGGKVGRLYDSSYILAIPYNIRIEVNDNIYMPHTDDEGGIIFPLLKMETYRASDHIHQSFDFGKKDFTAVGITIK